MFVEYHAVFDASKHPGVLKKIDANLKAAQNLGYRADKKIVWGPFWRRHLTFFKNLISSKADIIIVRFCVASGVLQTAAFIWQRIKGAKIIIDVPTPVSAVAEEIKGIEFKIPGHKALKLALMQIGYPAAFWPANLIIEYSDEQKRYAWGCRNKMHIIGNGIDVRAIDRIKRPLPDSGDNINLVGVASLSFWHGYDRILKGIAGYYQAKQVSGGQKTLRGVHLWIVGNGSEYSSLVALTNKLEINEYVTFTGFLTGEPLNDLYVRMHIGVASLGLHRIGLNKASVLKAREYACHGLPMVMSADDPDFSSALPFVYKVPKSDQPLNIESLMGWYSRLSLDYDLNEVVRRHALNNLSMEKKFAQIVRLL